MADRYANNMPRDERESQRLLQQFDMLTENIGYLVHPSIQTKLPSSPMVADLATGNGVFLQRFAAHYPSATLHGFDISADQFPPSDTLPSNMKLDILDIRQPIPAELQGTYDLVHVRLIVLGMLKSDWAPAARNIATLLKPGGAIQWEEGNFAALQFLRGRDESSGAAMRFVGEAFKSALWAHYAQGWDLLALAMQAAGLVDVETDVVSSDRVPETRTDITTNLMGLILNRARKMVSRGTPELLDVDHPDDLEHRVEKDMESGCYVRYDIHIVRGTRPK